jgi:hypothetical protein
MKELTHTELLVWLQDHRGSVVSISFNVECGGYSASVLSASGTLRFWRDSSPDVAASSDQSGLSRVDIVGLFYVGSDDSVSLDLSDLPEELTATQREHEFDGDVTEEVTLHVAENAWLTLRAGK